MRLRLALLASLLAAPALARGQAAPPAPPPSTEPPEGYATVVVRAFPLGDPDLDARTAPFGVDRATAADLSTTDSPNLLEGLERRIPGVFLGDSQGNGFAQTLDFHGFSASPLAGTPQGLAVYLGGLRLNEAFGDTVNWDLIPQAALAEADVLTGDPAFGLNAIGGAVALRAKTGKTFQGGALDFRGGSFGRGDGAFEYGRRDGDWNLYVAADGGREDGWRQRSPSRVSRIYADIGRDIGPLELHLFAAGSATFLGVVGPTPVDLLSADRTAVFTSPQRTRSDDALAGLNAAYRPGGAWSFTGEVHGRTFNQRHTDGNDADVEGCSSRAANPLYGTLCLEDDDFPQPRPPAASFQLVDQAGNVIRCPTPAPGTRPCAGVPYGTVDRTRTDTDTVGGSAQANWSGRLFGRRNHLVAGVAIDHSTFAFSSDSQIAFIGSDFVVAPNPALPSQGATINTRGYIGYAPVDLDGDRTDYGVYLADLVDLTDRLSLTLSGRYNEIGVSSRDRLGTSPGIDGDHDFSRFNPQAGLSYRITPGLNAYVSYSEANRAPTPLELSCSDPTNPCLLENALVADPPLKQVSSRSVEAGVKGGFAAMGGRIDLRVSGYEVDVDNDILAQPSVIAGRGSYANVPRTRRRGVDLGAELTLPRVRGYLGYGFVDATYGFSGSLSEPNTPGAEDDGSIAVRPGDRIGGVPQHRVKLGAEYDVLRRLTVGTDLVGVSSQSYVGDENGSQPKLPGYVVVNVRGEYRLTPRLSFTAQVYNLLDHDYATYGTFFDGDGVANAGSSLPDDPDPRTLTPAPPRSFRVGVRYRW